MNLTIIRIFLPASLALFVGISSVNAEPILWVHDESENLGTVDAATGDVSIIGDMGVRMTDIAFDPDGNLFGVSFTDFYSIDPTDASTTLIGSHGVSNGNALVFNTEGVLYSAGAQTTDLFTLDVATGAGTALFDMGVESAGDLAFFGDRFFLADNEDRLVEIDLNGESASIVGDIGFDDVFGLATPGDGILYGVSGTQVITIDPDTGEGSPLSDYGGQGLGASGGSSFFTEAGAGEPPTTDIPLPATLSLLTAGLAMLGFGSIRRRLRS